MRTFAGRLLPLLVLLSFQARSEDASCTQVPFADLPAVGDVIEDQVTLTAEQAEVQQDGKSRLQGSVRLLHGDRLLSTDRLDYDKQRQRVRVDAESVFRNRSVMVRSQAAEFDIPSRTGQFDATEFLLLDRAARGSADRMQLSASGAVELEQVSYTSCAADSDAWYLRASDIRLDTDSGLGTARNARLEFGGIPILYTPYLRFPIDDRRRTGLLYPSMGQSNRNGFEFRWPLYLNLGPNYDATLTPRYMAERGTQLISDGRYLLRDGEGALRYEYLDNDREFAARGLGHERAFGSWNHVGLFGARTEFEASYAEVSDDQYFEDLGGELGDSSTTHLERFAELTYVAPASYTVGFKVQDYQTVSATVATANEPFRRLPQITVDTLTRKSWRNLRLGFSGEYVNFERDFSVAAAPAVAAQPQSGQRLDLRPYLRFQRDINAWYLNSQVEYRYTAYDLEGASGTLAATSQRQLPVFSAETGLRFERLTSSGSLQTLEPKLFYLHVPYRDQSALPEFDTGEPDFDFPQLFALNRFSGEDRVSDANLLTAAFTTRMINPDDGFVRLSGSLGQITRFESPRVMISTPGYVAPGTGSTDLIAGLDYRFTTEWSLVSSVQWSPDSSQLVRNSYALRYRDGRRRADLGYRYRDTILEQADASAALPIYGAWSGIGRWRYSLANNQTLEGLAGLEYETCCWAVRSAYRRYVATTAGDYSNGIYIQLELKSLTNIGTGVRELLPQD